MRQEDKERLPEFAARLRRLAEIRGLGQIDIARNLFLPASRVGNWFQGKNFPKPSEKNRLAEILDVSVSFLLYGNEKHNEEFLSQENNVSENESVYQSAIQHIIGDFSLKDLVDKLDEIMSDEQQDPRARVQSCKVFIEEIKKRVQ